MRRLTLQTLRYKNVCEKQTDLFWSLFKERVEITEELCVSVANMFNWDWAAENLLSPLFREKYVRDSKPFLAEYNQERISFWDKYDRDVIPFQDECNRALILLVRKYNSAVGPPPKEYDHDLGLLLEKYNRAVRPLQEEHDYAVRPSREKYDSARAQLWASLYIQDV